MYLYLVDCICATTYSGQIEQVYVVAADPTQAEKKALKLMKNLGWKYDDRVGNIKLLASVNTHKAQHLLVT